MQSGAIKAFFPQLGDNARPDKHFFNRRGAIPGVSATFLKAITLATRNKRWNGNFDSLPVEYLKGVLEKMGDYGDRVRFSLVSGGPEPSYQVVNTQDKTMAFDRNHHLLKPEGDEFVGANATRIYTLEQVNAAIAGIRSSSTSAPRAARVVRAGSGTGGTRTSAARLEEQFAAQRYEYFRNNRSTLPPRITEYTEEITELMKKGKPVEEAFGEVVKKYF